ncbi:UDP-glucose--hexose-1-phosphate uridylyltransferase [Clostridium tarantellae]|uniref:Galactose-1-phosphate uridylyltransferase n=1 Tax=Clostridium tarantellae TaxID=39493 RepID=A0A6I1MR27_9CLOT|nr:UDP-glucose--hexose-1-phosphate uridylyltransferase [Clostridium tarantellae]
MNKLNSLIDRLITLSIDNGLIDKMDEIYVRNRLLSILKENNYSTGEKLNLTLHETLNELINIAINKDLISNSLYEKDIFSSNLMNCFIPSPSIINKEFLNRYEINPIEATNYFYNLSKSSNYIRTDRIAKNINFKSSSNYGDMEITINLSKPEKDPKQIALERNSIKSNYPKCLLCTENEGFEGTITHPDRANHRMIRFNINNKNWMLQYSPYLYYNEHCILLCNNHIPMKINKDTFINLLQFVDKIPHYFIGSNADLPIVGGSILSHEHYQGGNHTFPMNSAKKIFDFTLDRYKDICLEVLNWPLSTIRLKGSNILTLVDCSQHILNTWRNYSDESVEILSHSNNEPHNTITPIVRKENDEFIVDLVLRNNRTSKEHPLGIFHPHVDVQHIKKENIGLIEVMGLAVLPGRLLNELEDIKKFILNELIIEKIPKYHSEWCIELKAKYTEIKNSIPIDDFINTALANKFVKVLEYCGVFNINTSEGINAFKKFVSVLNK